MAITTVREVKLQRWLLFFLILEAVLILILSLLPDPPDPELDIPFLDKILHALAYFVLCGSAVFTFSPGKKPGLVVVLCILCCVVYGGTIELLQGLTGRMTELADLLADGGGAVPGALAGLMVYRKWPLKNRPGAD